MVVQFIVVQSHFGGCGVRLKLGPINSPKVNLINFHQFSWMKYYCKIQSLKMFLKLQFLRSGIGTQSFRLKIIYKILITHSENFREQYGYLYIIF